MKVELHVAALQDLNDQIIHLEAKLGQVVAKQHLERVEKCLQTMAQYPRAARYHGRSDIYETWFPGTRFIAFYRVFPEQQLTVVLAIIDHARNTAPHRQRLIKSRGQ
jgi:plasmid stabilization system protein ParE